VRRGAMPSVVAPGRNRPIMRSHAETGWRSKAAFGIHHRFLLKGTQISGGSLSRVSPKTRVERHR